MWSDAVISHTRITCGHSLALGVLLMVVVVGYGMSDATGADLANWALKAAKVFFLMIIYINFNTLKTLSDWPVWRNIAPTSTVRVRVAVVNLCFSCSNSSAGEVGADSAVFRRTRDWSLSSLACLSHLRLCHCSPVNVICSKLSKAICDWKTHFCAYLHISVL